MTYHSVHPRSAGALATPEPTPELFAHHLGWLKQHCDIVPFGRVLEATREKWTRPLVSITFDDGFADNYEYALPLLLHYGVHATFFLTAGFLDKDPAVLARFRTLWHRWRLPAEQIRPMEWTQVREMRRLGMDVGAHTYSHPNLAELGSGFAESDLRKAKQVLEDRLGQHISLMAYPFGKPRRHFTDQTVSLVAKVGYKYAAALICRRVSAFDSPFMIPRFYVVQDDVTTLRDKASGAWDLFGSLQERLPSMLRE